MMEENRSHRHLSDRFTCSNKTSGSSGMLPIVSAGLCTKPWKSWKEFTCEHDVVVRVHPGDKQRPRLPKSFHGLFMHFTWDSPKLQPSVTGAEITAQAKSLPGEHPEERAQETCFLPCSVQQWRRLHWTSSSLWWVRLRCFHRTQGMAFGDRVHLFWI